MIKQAIIHLELLLNFLSAHFVKKEFWKDVTKAEWIFITEELNSLIIIQTKKQSLTIEPALLGLNYLYEHLILKKLVAAKKAKNIKSISNPNLSKLNQIVWALGYTNYYDFIEKHSNTYNFSDLKINLPGVALNTALLNALVGYWYSYNRNLPEHPKKDKEERIWRSAIEIYKSPATNEYLIEKSGGGQHKYYGKITAYEDYIFIIMNSNTFIRQRHFVARLKDIQQKLKQPNYTIQQMHFISTCISFNEEPIALFEIFDRVTHIKKFVNASIDFPLGSEELPNHITVQIKDASKNRLLHH
jgi:hypothetical protein